MADHPMPFRGPMVRDLLAGTKTQTRQVLKLKPWHEIEERDNGSPWPWMYDNENSADYWVPCPYGRPGDLLWVRETWADLVAVSPATGQPMPISAGERLIKAPTFWIDEKGLKRWHYDGQVIAYRANSDIVFCDGDGFSAEFADQSSTPRWRSSRHMPRWASRLTLRITDVRVERLQDISDSDAVAEGMRPNLTARALHRESRMPPVSTQFADLWDYINGPGSWDANPWVWAISFEVLRQNVDMVLAELEARTP